jgi:uncharacterized membrane-anchored protein YjiN (DUF445 family)
VGGLADWFAVRALFGHPFGIPFPHTAIGTVGLLPRIMKRPAEPGAIELYRREP